MHQLCEAQQQLAACHRHGYEDEEIASLTAAMSGCDDATCKGLQCAQHISTLVDAALFATPATFETLSLKSICVPAAIPNPCAGSPCDGLARAVRSSCIALDSSRFSCSCEQGYQWNGAACIGEAGYLAGKCQQPQPSLQTQLPGCLARKRSACNCLQTVCAVQTLM